MCGYHVQTGLSTDAGQRNGDAHVLLLPFGSTSVEGVWFGVAWEGRGIGACWLEEDPVRGKGISLSLGFLFAMSWVVDTRHCV